jgi:3-phenylpropionate/trans-cinnamate dioxygenase ferredoxin subunit
MATFKRVVGAADLAPGRRITTWVSGVKVLVVNAEGQLYAVDEQCTHMQCSMTNGPLQGTVLVCPCHLAAFDLRSGKVLKGPATVDLPTYKVKIEGGDLLIEERAPELV